MPAGRPPLYTSPEELEDIIQEYFDSCVPEFLTDAEKKPVLDNKGNPVIISMNYPTITGLAYALGFISRQSIYDNEKRNEEYSYVIARARLFIESNYEQGLHGKAANGCQFALKNMGWKDKTEVEQSGTTVQRVINVNPSKKGK